LNGHVLELNSVSLLRGSRAILDGVSFSVGQGTLAALTGPSGSGKTTLLRAVAGLDPFDSGTIVVNGLALEPGTPARSRLRQTSSRVGLVFQFHCLFEHLSAIRNVMLAPVHAHRMSPLDAERRAAELLKTFGVDHRASALPCELSGGEAQRVAIARALAVDPPLLLMDEPTAALDGARRAELGALLRRLTTQGKTVLIATHDEDFVNEWSTSVLRLSQGRVSAAGSQR
jgi:ABC-type polar amino acid transport system ATPase subunit